MSHLHDCRNAVYRAADALGFPAVDGVGAGMDAWAEATRLANIDELEKWSEALWQMTALPVRAEVRE